MRIRRKFQIYFSFFDFMGNFLILINPKYHTYTAFYRIKYILNKTFRVLFKPKMCSQSHRKPTHYCKTNSPFALFKIQSTKIRKFPHIFLPLRCVFTRRILTILRLYVIYGVWNSLHYSFNAETKGSKLYSRIRVHIFPNVYRFIYTVVS